MTRHDVDALPARPGPTVDTPAAHRARFRDGLVRPTSGLAPGFTQANMIVLPRDWAYDMLLFAQRNPAPMPLLDVTDPGDPTTAWASGADLRTDLPLYRIWQDGDLVEEVPDATAHWPEDAVAFLIGYAILSTAYFVLRHVFYAQGAVTVIIELVGGIVFLFVVMRKGRL